MEPIYRYDALSSLVSAQLTRGVATNTFLTPEAYRREMETGTLFCHNWPGGLLLLRARDGYHVLNYYLQKPLMGPEVSLPPQTVLEIPVRPGREEEAERVLSFWGTQGFMPLLKRIRLARKMLAISPSAQSPAGCMAAGHAFHIESAKTADTAVLLAFLEAFFDRRTGCLPTVQEMAAAIGAGQVFLALGEDGTLGGMVHFKCTSAVMEIRHLAVHTDVRGHGLAKQLVQTALERQNTLRAQVWTGADNEAARSVYAGCGYRPDGWTSEVWIKP